MKHEPHPTRSRWWIRAGVALLLLAAMGTASCRCDEPPPAASSTVEAKQSAPAASGQPPATGHWELLKHLDDCWISHDGPTLDFGTRASAPHLGYVVVGPQDQQVVERSGSSFVPVSASRTSFDLWTDSPRTGASVRLRVYGGRARGVTVFIDKKRVGSARIESQRIQTLTVARDTMEVAGGRHTILLHFWGRQGADANSALAELDWLQLGDASDDVAGTYDAPTSRQIVIDQEVNGQPKHSIALRAPAGVRCPLRVAADAKLRLALSYWGNGKGEAEIRIVSEQGEPVVLERHRVAGGDGATWAPVVVDLKAHAGKLVGVELAAVSSTRGGRVLFGEPELVRSRATTPRAPRATTVVLVVAAGLDRRRIPPFGAIGELSHLGELARTGVAFEDYRVPTVLSAGVVASLLTGLSPMLHRVQNQASKLPAAVKPLSRIVKEAGGQTAFFTGVPTTSEGFGFDVGWDDYASLSPVLDLPATEPLRLATAWLEERLRQDNGPRLLVVHLRGGHPPWDLSKAEVAQLPPKDYSGILDARRGGVTLAKVRQRRRARQRRLRDEDWARLRALSDAAILAQDRALGRLMDVVEEADAWSKTMFIFTGDVSIGDPPGVPYEPAGELSEDRLLVPLVVRFPDGAAAAKSVATPVSSVDVAHTIATSLGVELPHGDSRRELYRLANGLAPLVERPLVATLGNRYSTRLGAWLLRGRLGRTPELFRIDVDPGCTEDRFDQSDLASPALWQATFGAFEPAFGPASQQVSPEPATIEGDLAAALTVWGDLQ